MTEKSPVPVIGEIGKNLRQEDVAMAVMALAREVWTLTDRQMVLEHVLTEAGIDVSRIDTLQPNEELEARLRARREAMLDRLIRTLRGETD